MLALLELLEEHNVLLVLLAVPVLMLLLGTLNVSIKKEWFILKFFWPGLKKRKRPKAVDLLK